MRPEDARPEIVDPLDLAAERAAYPPPRDSGAGARVDEDRLRAELLADERDVALVRAHRLGKRHAALYATLEILLEIPEHKRMGKPIRTALAADDEAGREDKERLAELWERRCAAREKGGGA
jgi:hypothetical protein